MRNYDTSAEAIAMLLKEMFHFKKVMDIGCTEEAWLKAFKKIGAEVFGVYMVGHPVNFQGEDIRTQAIDFGTNRFHVQEKQDLALSIDFAEKFPPELVGGYLDDLTGVSDVILFSSQLPMVISSKGKTGREKNPSHWKKLFEERGFVAIDCIRPKVWDSEDVLLEYRQSMMLYVREKSLLHYPRLLEFYLRNGIQDVYDVIHPELFLNNINYLQGKIDALTTEVENLNRKPKRVLYAFDHGAGLAWCLVHELTIYSSDDVYFLVPKDQFNNWKRSDKADILKRLVNIGIIKGIYTYRMGMGWDRKKFDSIEKCETEIINRLKEDFENEFCDITKFDSIYLLCDVSDNVGIYFTINKIKYFYCELGKGQFGMNANENAIRYLNEWRPVYRDVLLKHKTLICKSPMQTIITYPDTTCIKREDGRVESFDVEKAAINLPSDYKKKLKEVFNTVHAPENENIAMILTQSPVDTNEIYGLWPHLQSRYKDCRSYTLFTIQCMQDYYIPTEYKPVIKLHPEVATEKKIERYFDGAYVYHNLFTMILMRILPHKCSKPKYIIHNNFTSSRHFFDEKTQEILCPGVLYGATFIHKYYIALSILEWLKSLNYESGDMFDGVGERGKHRNYNTNRLHIDIESMIKVQFPMVETQLQRHYIVWQMDIETKCDKISSYDFVIYTDVWEILTLEELKQISQRVHATIIRITKKPIKPLEDILVPLQDEYIFFFSKDESYIEKLKSFHVTKLNKAMGIELSARIITMEEYSEIRR